jgi:hypothetical protein
MLENGKYAAFFTTPLKQGAGLAYLADGQIEGGDSFMTYAGAYALIGDRFTAVLHVTRHSEGPVSVFGVDNFTLSLEGKLVGKIASFTARANEVPDMILEGTLIRSEQDDFPSKPRRTIAKFDPRRLPTPPARGR